MCSVCSSTYGVYCFQNRFLQLNITIRAIFLTTYIYLSKGFSGDKPKNVCDKGLLVMNLAIKGTKIGLTSFREKIAEVGRFRARSHRQEITWRRPLCPGNLEDSAF